MTDDQVRDRIIKLEVLGVTRSMSYDITDLLLGGSFIDRGVVWCQVSGGPPESPADALHRVASDPRFRNLYGYESV